MEVGRDGAGDGSVFPAFDRVSVGFGSGDRRRLWVEANGEVELFHCGRGKVTPNPGILGPEPGEAHATPRIVAGDAVPKRDVNVKYRTSSRNLSQY